MARTLRRPALTLALPALVALSAVLHWLAARRVAGLWIMPDEAIYGVRALDLWQHGTLPLFGRSGAGYSALYPVLAGGPLSIGSLATGYELLKPVQATVMSLAAVPVYLYVRRPAGEARALLAAALTVAVPIVLFSGFVMSEVLYYPLATAALLTTARAVETRAHRDQAISLVLIGAAVATRVQGVVLLAVLAASILVDAMLRRRAAGLERHWPVWALVGACAVVVLALPGAFGAYEGAVTGSYDLGAGFELAYHQLAYLVLMVGVVPVAALVLLAVEAAGARVDPAERAVVSVALAAVALVVVQVGVFGSRYAPHLLGRDLASLPPLLFTVFALWLGRGAPRPRLAASLTAFAVLAVVVSAPWNELVSWDAFPDSPGISLLLQSPVGWQPLTAAAVVGGVLLVLFRFAPFPEALGLVMLALFVWGSVKATDLVAAYSTGTQTVLVGTPRDWVDRTAHSPVAYVYDGDLASWPVVWEQRFWNRRIERVVSIVPHDVPGPIPQVRFVPPPDGRLPVEERYAVANDRLTLRGDAIAHQDRGPNQHGLTLWRLAGPPRLATVVHGVQPNGDMIGPATVTAYDCAGGSLLLTLLPKATSTLEIDLDGRPVLRADVGGRPSWTSAVPVPRTHGRAPCTFTIRGGLLLGSTRLAFAYPG